MGGVEANEQITPAALGAAQPAAADRQEKYRLPAPRICGDLGARCPADLGSVAARRWAPWLFFGVL